MKSLFQKAWQQRKVRPHHAEGTLFLKIGTLEPIYRLKGKELMARGLRQKWMYWQRRLLKERWEEASFSSEA